MLTMAKTRLENIIVDKNNPILVRIQSFPSFNDYMFFETLFFVHPTFFLACSFHPSRFHLLTFDDLAFSSIFLDQHVGLFSLHSASILTLIASVQITVIFPQRVFRFVSVLVVERCVFYCLVVDLLFVFSISFLHWHPPGVSEGEQLLVCPW